MLLTTERLILRDFVESDWPDVHAYGSDPDVVRFMPFEPGTVEQTHEHIRRCLAHAQEQPRKIYDLGVVLKAENRVIGGCTLAITNAQAQQAAFSYLFNRQYWGRGYATEAMRALLHFGFAELGLHRIADTCDTENVASARVMEKLGMRREGHLREFVWSNGRWRDHFIYAILADEWQAGYRQH